LSRESERERELNSADASISLGGKEKNVSSTSTSTCSPLSLEFFHVFFSFYTSGGGEYARTIAIGLTRLSISPFYKWDRGM
jgi:hypothetical protein